MNQTITSQDFELHMEAMRAHYKSANATSYALPVMHLHYSAPDNAPEEQLPKEAKDATMHFKGQVEAFNIEESNGMKQSVQRYKDTQNQASFDEEMEKGRKEAKRKADQQIDHYYDKMKEIGHKHHGAQRAILTIVRAVSDFFNYVLNKLLNFITYLVDKIVEIVSQASKAIGDFFSDVTNDTVNFFENCFS